MSSRFQPKGIVVLVLATLAFSSAWLGCGGGDDSESQDTRPPEVQRAPYTGRELYEGMFFGTGRGAQVFPEIWNNERVKAQIHESPQKLDFEKAARTIADQIQKQDPGFFQRFGADIQSRDHVLIAKALTDARKNTEQAARTLQEARRGVNAMGVTETNSTPDLGIYPCLYYDIVVAFDIAIAVYRWAVLAVAVFWAAEMEGHPMAGALSFDQWVDTLAHKDFTPQAL